MSGNRPRDGARHFTVQARELVANSDPFSFLHKGEFRRRSDGRDLLAALLLAEGKADAMKGLTAGGRYAATALGCDVEGHVGGRAVRELNELGWLADAGGCRTTEMLRAALLGETPMVSHEAAARQVARDEAMFSEEGC